MLRCIRIVSSACLLVNALTLSAGAAPLPNQDQAASPNASQTTTPKTVRISGGVMAGNETSKVNPVYPQQAKDAHISGTVVLAALIGTDGLVQDVKVVSGPPELTQAAIDAVKQWTYKPYLLNGQPVRVNTTVTLNFQSGGRQR